MNEAFARELCLLNDRFYESQSASFSATRASFWEGWGRVAQAARSLRAVPVLRVLDVACGNLRFERFLADEFPDAALRCVAVDNCEALVPADLPGGVRFVRADVMDELRRGRAFARWGGSLVCPAAPNGVVDGASVLPGVGGSADGSDGLGPDAFEGNLFDLSVCFGFLHHVPLEAWRMRLLDALLDATRPGGLVAVSLWRFMDNARLAEKARRTTVEALGRLGWQNRADELGAGDWLLGWQDTPGAYRYCHSFDDADVDALVRHVAQRAHIVARFRADGRTHDLNEYVVLRRR